MAPSQAEATALIDLLNSTLALLTQFTTSLHPTTTTTTTSSSETINPTPASTSDASDPLLVLRDASALLKAHTTKLSLLAINKPFTPSAIRKVLVEATSSCVPALVSGAQLCAAPERGYGRLMARESAARVRRVLAELGVLVREVREVAEHSGGVRRRESLAATGVVWASCEAVAELAGLGVGGLAAQKATQDRETVRDAIAELREWVDGEDEELEGGDALLDESDEGVEGDRDGVEALFHAANSMPAERPALRALVERAEAQLKKVVLLYTAVLKRRCKTFTGVGGGVERLDACVESLRRVPHQVDELASVFYDLDEEQAAQMLATCVAEAKRAGTAVLLNWDGREDEYTAWYRKWEDAIGD
nr:uncharacterized protein c22e12.18 [Quercus suber]